MLGLGLNLELGLGLNLELGLKLGLGCVTVHLSQPVVHVIKRILNRNMLGLGLGFEG